MSLDPPENRRNIVHVFPFNAGPVKNHKVANLAFNVGSSSVCQQIQWRFAGIVANRTTLARSNLSPFARYPLGLNRHFN